ncbi:XRE family transcriptional regulator [Nocardia fluminea]|nr:XRE family transcriptional regulator [Nocardia fluminea]
MSIREFAALLGIETTTVNNWRSGLSRVKPRSEKQSILDTVYLLHATPEDRARFNEIVAEGEDAWRNLHHPPKRTTPSSPKAVDALALARWLASDGTGIPPISCSDDLERVGLALDSARRYFDGSVLEFFRSQLVRCKADDGSLGPAEALPLTLAIVGAIRRHSNEVPAELRRQLLAIGSDGAEFAGWLYRDLDDPVTAMFLYDRSMEWAQEAGNLPMQGYVLLKRSEMAYDSRDAGSLLGLARAAKDGPWQLPHRVRAQVAQQEALGLAMSGEPVAAVEECIGLAEQLLAQADGADDRGLVSNFAESTLRVRSAVCYTEAGKPQRATELFGQVLMTGGLSRRDAGFFGARRAKALALSGEPDEAAAVATKSVAVGLETRSERTIKVVVDVLRTLAPWDHRPGVRQLRDAVKLAS